jgi:putative spermidine/putrescine transport system substrate-binding protein
MSNRRVFASMTGFAAVAAVAAGVGISSAGASTNWSTVTSAKAGGGMSALVAAAEKEGKLNAITLPDNWANYGEIMKKFSAKYHIKINDAIPSGSSSQEIQAVESDKGRSNAPDVLDIGQSFAALPANQKLYAPYKVANWAAIPASDKDSAGHWYGDYGGIVSFGCDSQIVKSCPTTWSQLLSAPANSVALNGVPGQAGAATGAVWAAALNNGGSFTNAEPGLKFFGQLKSKGILNSTDCDSSSVVAAGSCPILINWDFLNNAKAWGLKGSLAKAWKVVDPKGTPFAESYYQAISATAPDPAAARLWEEYLYSTTGQNLYLQGYARPAEQAAMVKNKTIDESAFKLLPPVSGNVAYPSAADATKAGTLIASGWPNI